MTDNGHTNLIERQTIALEAIAKALTKVAGITAQDGKPAPLEPTTLERREDRIALVGIEAAPGFTRLP